MQGRPLSDHETLRLCGLENGERFLRVLERLELADDLIARDEVIRSALDSNVGAGPFVSMQRLLDQKRYREAVLLHLDFERLTSSFNLPSRHSDPFKYVGTQAASEQIMEVLNLLRDHDRPQDARAVVTAVALKRHQRLPYFWAALRGLLGLGLPAAIAAGVLGPSGPPNSLQSWVILMLLPVFGVAVILILMRWAHIHEQDMVDVCVALRDNGHQDVAAAVLVTARDKGWQQMTRPYRPYVTARRLRQVGLPEAAEFILRHRTHLDLPPRGQHERNQ
jgi:hypothetical protein